MTSSLQVSAFLAVRGLQRGNKFTLGLTILIMGLVFVMMVFQPSILTGFIKAENDQITDYSYANIALEPKENHTYIENVNSLTKKIDQIPGVVASSAEYTTVATFTYQQTSLGEPLTAVTPSEDNLVLKTSSRLIGGDFLSDGDTDQIVIGSLLAGHKDTTLDVVKSLGGVQVGDSIDVTFSNGVTRRYHVKGIFETQSTSVDQSAIITTKEMESVTGLSDKASLVLIRLSSSGNEDEFRNTLMQYGIQEPIKTWSEEGAAIVGEINTSLSLIDSIMIVVSLIIGGIVIFIVMFINTVNKRKQIAIMKAIGIKKEIIINNYLIQVGVLCLAGIILGLVMFDIITYFLTIHPLQFSIGGVPPLIDPTWIVESIISLVIVSLVSGFIPAWQVANEEILDAMRG